MVYFQRPAKRDEDYDSDDERRRRKKVRRDQNLGIDLGVNSTGFAPPSSLAALASKVSTFFRPGTQGLGVVPIPGVKRTLQAFQETGVAWIRRALGCGVGVVLADEMGLGKTTQAIAAFVASCPPTPATRPKLLVAAPLSVVPSWMEEFNAVLDLLASGLVVRRYGGTREERDAFVSSVESTIGRAAHADGESGVAVYQQSFVDVVVTTPEYLLSDSWFLGHLHFDMIIFDEAHRLKNAQSRLYERLMQQYLPHIPKRLLLTGTPLSNSPLEFWNLLRLANPVLFSGCTALNGMDASTGDEYSRAAVERLLTEDATNVAALRSLSDSLLLRRLKADVLKGLPPMTEVVLRVPLSPLQLSLYSGILKNDVALLGSVFSSSSANGGKISLLNTLMQLRKCCNHPYMFTGVEPEPFVSGEHLVLHSGKMVVLDKLLSTLQQEGHRVLLFSQYTYALDIIQDYLEYRKWSFVRLDGSVRGEDRESAVQTFQRNVPTTAAGGAAASDARTPFVFLLSTRAGGVGLTLTAADTVIFYDSDWNPQMDLQAQQRAHRIGQTRPVTVYRLCSSNTVEEGILAVAAKKRKLAADFIDRPVSSTADDEEDSGKLSASDLKDMVRLAIARLPKASGSDGRSGDLGSAESQWAKFAASLSIANLLSVASASHALDLGESLKNDADQRAFQETLEALRTEAAAARKTHHRRDGSDNSAEIALDDRDDPFQKKKTSEAERLIKMQKPWSKTGYVTSGLPLTSDVYEATSTLADDSPIGLLSILERSMIHHAGAVCKNASLKDALVKALTENTCAKPKELNVDGLTRATTGGAADETDERCVEEEQAGAPVEHVRGDLFAPITDLKHNPLRIVIVPVNNGGTWGSGRLFSSAQATSPDAAAQYGRAKENNDLRLGDAHLMWTPQQTCSVQIVLAVIQRSSTAGYSSGGDVDLKALDTVMRRIEAYARVFCEQWKLASSCTLHFPLFNALSKEASYALDKILAKYTGGAWKRCYMYHAPNRLPAVRSPHASPTAPIPLPAAPVPVPRPVENHDSSLRLQLVHRLPVSPWSLSKASTTSIFMFASAAPPTSSMVHLTNTVLASGGVFATLAEAHQYLLEGESPATFVIITSSDEAAVSSELAHFVEKHPSMLVVSERWLLEHP